MNTKDRIEIQYQQETSENATDDGMPEAPEKIRDWEDANFFTLLNFYEKANRSPPPEYIDPVSDIFDLPPNMDRPQVGAST
jgi:hypothetical protein